MSEICIFAGTTEGRRLVERLSDQPLKLCVCVATPYGRAMIPDGDNVEVLTGRLDRGDMRALLASRRFDAVIDATHPYATEVSGNLSAACADTDTAYLRLDRAECGAPDDAIYVDTVQDAADRLAKQTGRALLTTGSKELGPYSNVPGFDERFYVRVLPSQASLAACEAAGFSPSHIIAMQGPFSVDMNVATLRAVGADWLVTKASGQSGDFEEKIEAAGRIGARCIVIGRPVQPSGVDFEGALRWLCGRFKLKLSREIAVIGIGMGSKDTLTLEADKALKDAECIIGAERSLKAVSGYGHPQYAEIAPQRIAAYIEAHAEYRRFAVVMSGDTGFYSGAKKLLPLLAGESVRVIPGLSTLQVLCARVGTSWDDVHAISLHGRDGSAAEALRRWGKVFALLDGTDAVRRVCRELCDASMGDARVTLGERLSYPDEKLTVDTAQALADRACAPLSAVLLEYGAGDGGCRIGLPDEMFERDTGSDCHRPVPMTKREVRAICVSRLCLRDDSVVYDIGAGTGSVSIEMALNCPEGRVFAIECREEAAMLIDKNRRRFGLSNLTVVRGRAPESMADLPVPTHAFIGGSSGDLSDIIAALIERNPDVHIVANAVTLESIAELSEAVRRFGLAGSEFVQVSIARSRAVGKHHLMSGMNPVYVADLRREEVSRP
ncbi:MAG: precorrin-6A reductase [Clostridia bacterium]|nr:precorrin-6A reductase [Clostridia bacterium]